MRGRVKFYDVTRGFGFIANDAGGKDVFVHATALVGEDRELFANDAVEFETEIDRRSGREKACRVRVLA